MEQMQYNLLFRWFVGLGIDDPVWVPAVFSKNRDRLLTTDIARQFLAAILADKAVAPLLSDEHFSVDGTLIQAWASMKSFQPKEAASGAEPAAGGDAGPGQDGRRADQRTGHQRRRKSGPGWRCASHGATSNGPQRRGGFPWPEALERYPRLAHRSGGTSLSQGDRARKPSSASWATL